MKVLSFWSKVWKLLARNKGSVDVFNGYDLTDSIDPNRLTGMLATTLRERLEAIDAARVTYPVLALKHKGFTGYINREFGELHCPFVTESPYGSVDASTSTVDNMVPERKELSFTFIYVPVEEEVYNVVFDFETKAFPRLEFTGPKIQYLPNTPEQKLQLKQWIRDQENNIYTAVAEWLDRIIAELPERRKEEEIQLIAYRQQVYDELLETYIREYGDIHVCTDSMVENLLDNINGSISGLGSYYLQQCVGKEGFGLSNQRYGYFYYELTLSEAPAHLQCATDAPCVVRVPLLGCDYTPLRRECNFVSLLNNEHTTTEQQYVFCKLISDSLHRPEK